ncbi:MAG TPA: glycerol-3-phosphate dehydrogenase/oxidase [Thermomicrobiales bacterium]|nr:glycerol-3-phosphate dehydrogenase/oxidase [Thermomicrobiales bacterium]
MGATRPTYDLIVIGAGINGAGIARDAAMRGLRVLLLDKGDLGGGTSSGPTRLIHGGLRYLEHGEIGLVRESLRERERLLHAAPHLVQPLPLLIPIYRGDRRGWRLIKLGMAVYDLLSFDKSLPRHQMLSRRHALALAPGLRADGLLGAARYFDAQVEFPERLVVENALSARAHGATLRTYTRVEQVLVEGGRVIGARIAADGRASGENVFAPVVVNVAGPWVDAVLAGAPGAAARELVGGTKGSHLAVPPFPGAPRDALYVEAQRDARPFFIIPWNDLFLIGTTEEPFAGDLDALAASDSEIAYLLEETNWVIPDAGLDWGDIRYTYAAVRPLPHQPGGESGATTRRHIVHDHAAEGGPTGLISIVGGKLTTYRELAEQTVDVVCRRLGQPATASPTRDAPLPGNAGVGEYAAFARDFAAGSGLPTRSAEHLLRVYGARATSVLARATTPDLREPFDPESGAIGAEVVFAVEAEAARTLTDVLMRRTMAGYDRDAGIGADVAAADVARRHLGWNEARVAAEVTAYRAFVARRRSPVAALEERAAVSHA